MGSSAKRKKEKKQDFQKPKLKVGKTKPKPANQTDTSFRSKSIVLNQQSLQVTAPTTTHQFQHHVSMLSSRADAQRKESLAYLTTFLSNKPVNTPLPQSASVLVEKMCPLILDGSNAVRDQALKLFQAFKVEELNDHVSRILPFVRAGMTHLSRDIRLSTTYFLSWLLEAAGNEVVSCPGGWVKTLESFVTLLGWKVLVDAGKWSSSKTAFGNDAKMIARVMQVLAQLLQIGFDVEDTAAEAAGQAMSSAFPLWHCAEHTVSRKSNAYFYLGLYESQQAEEGQILEDREDRISIFNDRFRNAVATGVEAAKHEGGELGRAAGLVTKALKLANPD